MSVVSSEAQIVNMALRYIGAQPIINLSDDSDEGRVATLLYPVARDEVLRDFPWNFAIRRQQLSIDAGDNLTNYDYKYNLPVDPLCLRALDLIDSEGYTLVGYSWIVEDRYLYTDYTDVRLQYIGQITDVTKFDSKFVKALTFRLAADMAYELTGAARNDLEQKYEMQMMKAKGMDAREGQNRPRHETKWSDARWIGSRSSRYSTLYGPWWE